MIVGDGWVEDDFDCFGVGVVVVIGGVWYVVIGIVYVGGEYVWLVVY